MAWRLGKGGESEVLKAERMRRVSEGRIVWRRKEESQAEPTQRLEGQGERGTLDMAGIVGQRGNGGGERLAIYIRLTVDENGNEKQRGEGTTTES